MHRRVDQALELLAPDLVQLVYLLVLVDRKLCHVAHERLGCFGVFLGLKSVVLDLLLAVFFRLVTMAFVLYFGREYCWCRQDLVEVLELLPGLVFVRVCHGYSIDLVDIWEPIHDECPQEHCIRDLVAFNAETAQTLQGLQFRNLDETVDVVVLEQQPL